MQVNLISWTQSPEHKSLKDLVVYVARVSNPRSQERGSDTSRLWNYLQRHGHWSPFEMADVTLEIVCTRDISRQILRHRSFSFQEFSQRYSSPLEHLNFTFREARLQHDTNRQLSLPADDQKLQEAWVAQQARVKDVSISAYQWALDNGIAKEQARAVLPEGLTETRLYMKGSLRSWLHYFEVRCGPDTQEEHRAIAKEAQKIIWELIN